MPLPNLKMLSERTSTSADAAPGRGNRAYRWGSMVVRSLKSLISCTRVTKMNKGTETTHSAPIPYVTQLSAHLHAASASAAC